MTDTPVLWAECEHGEGDDHLHYGEQTVRRVPVGALLIPDEAAVERAAQKIADYFQPFLWRHGREKDALPMAREALGNALRAAIGDNG